MKRLVFLILLSSFSGCLFSSSSASTKDPTPKKDMSDMSVDISNDAPDTSIDAPDSSDVSDDVKSVCDVNTPLEECGDSDSVKVCDKFGVPTCSADCTVDYKPCRQREFKKISVGEGHACAIMSGENNVVCWGNGIGPTDRNHDFVEISVGSSITCGLNKDFVALCWNREGLILDSIGKVTQLSTGPSHRCFLHGEDSTVECIGINNQARPPELQGSTTLTSGLGFVCGIKSGDENIDCAGANVADLDVVLGKDHDALFTFDRYVCGLSNKRIACSDNVSLPTDTDLGVLKIATDKNVVCWTDTTKKLQCTGGELDLGTKLSYKLSELSVGNDGKFVCGIIAEGSRKGEIGCEGTQFTEGAPTPVNRLLKD